MHSSGFFWIKLIASLILKREISRSHTISDQSLLLSTNVLNDCFFVLMACQPRVCMRMRNTKYCIVEVPSKQAFINLVLD